MELSKDLLKDLSKDLLKDLSKDLLKGLSKVLSKELAGAIFRCNSSGVILVFWVDIDFLFFFTEQQRIAQYIFLGSASDACWHLDLLLGMGNQDRPASLALELCPTHFSLMRPPHPPKIKLKPSLNLPQRFL
ncbi:unnamed protein product [Discosporangium mesarthrocarpum]